jgi:hypothetical protein
MHEALMNALAERDEAHAQLIGSNVMHIHSLERERKKAEKLEVELRLREEIASVKLKQDFQPPNLGNLFGGNQPPNFGNLFAGKPDEKFEIMRKEIDLKIEAFHQAYCNSSAGDEEISQLCSQLSSEISAKTSNALEIQRLNEVRESERKTETAEKEALKEELNRLKTLLADEQKKSIEAREDANKWKQLYENQMKNGN